MNDKLHVLMKDYEMTKNAYNSVVSEYRKQNTILYTYVTLFITSAAVLSTNKEILAILKSLSIIVPIILVSSGIIMLYFFSTILDIVYHLYLVTAQLVAIEKKVNKFVGSNILNYDSQIITYFNEFTFNYKEWINPSYLVALISLVFILLLTFINIAFSIILVEYTKFSSIYSTILFFLSSYLLFQFFQLNGNGRNFIKQKTYEFHEVDYDLDDSVKTLTTGSNLYIVPIITFSFGFFFFIIYSISTQSFFLNSNVDIPTISQYTILLGDSLILPIVNFRILRVVIEKINFKNYIKRWEFILFVVSTLIISCLVNIETHKAWANDSFSDFIAFSEGELSFGGIWHLGFSIIQTFIILLILFFWIVAIQNRVDSVVKYCKNTWFIILGFNSLMIFNFIHQKSLIFSSLTWIDALTKSKFVFLGLFVNCIILFVVNNYYKFKRDRSY